MLVGCTTVSLSRLFLWALFLADGCTAGPFILGAVQLPAELLKNQELVCWQSRSVTIKVSANVAVVVFSPAVGAAGVVSRCSLSRVPPAASPAVDVFLQLGL